MNAEGNLPISEAADSEIEPTLRIALVLSALSVGGRPDTVMVVGGPYHAMHVT